MTDLRALTLKHLRAHEATVRHGSVTSAARELLVTPPAITAQLKTLEELVGAPLYDRRQGGFAPTEIGRVMLTLADSVEELVAHAAQTCRALHAGAVGTLTVGAVSTAKYLMPTVVARFLEQHSTIGVQLVIGNRADILRGLERNLYDVVIMGRPPDHLPLHVRVLSDHPHILIASPRHRLAGVPDIAPEQLMRERFLLREVGSGTRASMERFLLDISRDRPLDSMQMGTNETIKQSVLAGLGIALISAHTCLNELAEGKLVALDVRGLPINRQWYLLHRADSRLSTAAANFASFVAAQWRSLVPEGVPRPSAGTNPEPRPVSRRQIEGQRAAGAVTPLAAAAPVVPIARCGQAVSGS